MIVTLQEKYEGERREKLGSQTVSMGFAMN